MTRTRGRSGGEVSLSSHGIVVDARTIFLSGAGTGGSLGVVTDDGTPAIPHDGDLAGRPAVLHLGHPGPLVLSVADPAQICYQTGAGRP